ncbi:MAG: RNA 2',3'-cyclic phosphodiesterase [Anaerolineaceae bacterium]
MATIRTFIAAELTQASLSWASSTQTELSKLVASNDIKFTPLQQFHLTLAFIGDVDTRILPRFVSLMDNINTKLPILVSIDRIGHFSRNGSISVIWAGIKRNEILDNLNADILAQLKLLVRLERAPFKPHLTLARVKPEIDFATNNRIIEFAASNSLLLPFQDSISKVVLYKSDLKPAGPIYTRLHTIKLQDEIQ